MSEGLSRRGLLTGALAAAAGSAFALPGRHNPAIGAGRSLRVAFITDVHLDTTMPCVRGFVDCLEKIKHLDDRPDLIIQGGDLIMDGLSRDAYSVERQYDFARTILKRHANIPVEHVIGNHDIWGWTNPRFDRYMGDTRYGKGFWLNWTGYPDTYRSFDRGGWHFILLDSIVQDGRGYAARLDPTQQSWLEKDLASTPKTTPICIVSHVPILSTAALFFGPAEQTGHWQVPRSLMHIDARRIKDLLVKHPNVNACLSGHIHMQDRVEYNDVKHFGMGAVCGAWWRGPMQETPRQFAIVDFYTDGNVHATYVPI
jgi:Icc protein